MIVSFHPCFGADKYIICAGRKPDADDLAAMKAADAVILPQGCNEVLYNMASKNCSNIFPDLFLSFYRNALLILLPLPADQDRNQSLNKLRLPGWSKILLYFSGHASRK